MDVLAQIPLGEVGWSVVVLATVIAILRGDIVPRRTYDAIVTERDQWKEVALRNAELTNKALAGLEVTTKVVDALPRRRDEDDR